LVFRARRRHTRPRHAAAPAAQRSNRQVCAFSIVSPIQFEWGDAKLAKTRQERGIGFDDGAGSLAGSVPEQRGEQRTPAIEQELRRRGADRTRPQFELGYIGRLLEQF
jgi:hypothetical protein